MKSTWYVLRVSRRGETLLRCTHGRYIPEAVPAPARDAVDTRTQPPAQGVTEEANRYRTTGATSQAPEADPRATHVVQDLPFEHADHERRFRTLGHQLRLLMEENPGPLVLAMDPSLASMFETVAGVPVVLVLPESTSSSPDQLWELSRAALDAQGTIEVSAAK